jgi:MFS family permease
MRLLASLALDTLGDAKGRLRQFRRSVLLLGICAILALTAWGFCATAAVIWIIRTGLDPVAVLFGSALLLLSIAAALLAVMMLLNRQDRRKREQRQALNAIALAAAAPLLAGGKDKTLGLAILAIAGLFLARRARSPGNE